MPDTLARNGFVTEQQAIYFVMVIYRKGFGNSSGALRIEGEHRGRSAAGFREARLPPVLGAEWLRHRLDK
ncbi:MAG: hypothetical protein ABSC23_18235 [Bryobacteraceae bacterium]|jgi:hypothetical protein